MRIDAIRSAGEPRESGGEQQPPRTSAAERRAEDPSLSDVAAAPITNRLKQPLQGDAHPMAPRPAEAKLPSHAVRIRGPSVITDGPVHRVSARPRKIALRSTVWRPCWPQAGDPAGRKRAAVLAATCCGGRQQAAVRAASAEEKSESEQEEEEEEEEEEEDGRKGDNILIHVGGGRSRPGPCPPETAGSGPGVGKGREMGGRRMEGEERGEG